jgi:hypothetical protein
LGCNPQTARNAIHRFNEGGLEEAFRKGSSRAHTIHAAFDSEGTQHLREMLHRSPRDFGKKTSLWTLDLAAEVSFEKGLTEKRVSGETIRTTLGRKLGVRWRRAKRWITSPDPEYERNKASRPTDTLDETQRGLGVGLRGRGLVEPPCLPSLHSFSEKGKPLRLVKPSLAKDDPDPKAISCYGLYLCPSLKRHGCVSSMDDP